MEDAGNRLVAGCRYGGLTCSVRAQACRLPALACCLLALTCCMLTLPPLAAEARAAGGAPGRAASGPAAHDLHLATGDVAIESSLIAARIRFFQDDIERALAAMVGDANLSLQPGAEADALVLRYVRDKLRIRVDGQELEASFLGSGQDEMDLEPVWWVIVQFQAPGPPAELHVSNTLLFEVYDDQRNIFKFVHFPDETQRTFYFAEGESEHVVRF